MRREMVSNKFKNSKLLANNSLRRKSGWLLSRQAPAACLARAHLHLAFVLKTALIVAVQAGLLRLELQDGG
jgi:hypothetical protein